jgi:hypothetical protein
MVWLIDERLLFPRMVWLIDDLVVAVDHDCLNICNSCMPTMIVRDSMTVVFSKVEVPTITCVGFLKPCWTKEK